MTFEQFDEKYNPIIRDDNSICWWEPYGDDLLVVQSYPNNKVWTCIGNFENDDLYLIPGVYLINRLFYIICNKEWTDENEYVEYWKEDEMVV